jgi:hypothetical protein
VEEDLPHGQIHSADRIPPAWKAKPHFTDTKREVYGRLVQCRTGRAVIGEYYAKFVPLEGIAFQCDERFQPGSTYYGNARTTSSIATCYTMCRPRHPGDLEGLQVLAKSLEASGVFIKTGQPERLDRS